MSPPTSIKLAGAPPGRHVCAFFNDKEEELRVLVPFLAEGLREGDRSLRGRNA